MTSRLVTSSSVSPALSSSILDSLQKDKTITQKAAVLQKKKSVRLTQEIVDKIIKKIPDLDAGAITKKSIMEEHGLTDGVLNGALNKLKRGENPLERRASRLVTKEMVDLVSSKRKQLDSGELAYYKFSSEIGIDQQTIKKILRKLDDGKDPTKPEVPQKLTKELWDKVMKLSQKGALSENQIAEKLDISIERVEKIMKRQANGESFSTTRKADQEVTKEMVEQVKNLLPKIKEKKISENAAAQQCNMTKYIFKRVLKDLQNDKDPLEKKKPRPTTKKDVKNVKKLLPQIKRGELTLQEAATKSGLSSGGVVSHIIDKFKDGKDPAKRKLKVRVTEAMRKKMKTMVDAFMAGELTGKDGGKQLGISATTFLVHIKKLCDEAKTEEKSPSSKKADSEVTKSSSSSHAASVKKPAKSDPDETETESESER